MKRVLSAAATVALSVSLVGCGNSSRPHVQPDLAGKPTWGDCSTFSQQAMSIAEGATGAATLDDAIADYRHPGDHLLKAHREGGLAHRWAVDADGVIHVDLEVWSSDRGWFVTGVKRCAD